MKLTGTPTTALDDLVTGRISPTTTTVTDSTGTSYTTKRRGVTHAIIGWNWNGTQRFCSWTTKGYAAAVKSGDDFRDNGDGTFEIVEVK